VLGGLDDERDPVVDHALALPDEAAGLVHRQSRDGLEPGGLEEVGPEGLVRRVNVEFAANEDGVVVEPPDRGRLGLGQHLADYLLDDVLDGHDPGGRPELVDDDRHTGPLGARLRQEFVHRLGLRDDVRLRGDGAKRRPLVPVARLDRVQDVDDADDRVEDLLVDGELGDPVVQTRVDGGVEVRLYVHGDHVPSGHHRLLDDPVAEPEQPLEHPVFPFGEHARPLSGRDHLLDLRTRDVRGLEVALATVISFVIRGSASNSSTRGYCPTWTTRSGRATRSVHRSLCSTPYDFCVVSPNSNTSDVTPNVATTTASPGVK